MIFVDNYRTLSGPKRVLESLFIILVFISAFIFISLISHNADDPSWSQTGFDVDVQNMMGIVGANVSDILLFWLGFGSYIIPVSLLYLGFCVFVKDFNVFEVDFFTVGIRILGYFCLLVSSLALVSMNVANTDTYQSGGIIGGIISSFSISFLGELGTSLVFLVLFLVGIPFFTGISWLSVCDSLGSIFFNIVFFRSNRERKKAERQLAKMAEYRNSVPNYEADDDEDSGELTVFDPETGFSIYLREDSEIKYDGSCYDDDDYPKIRERKETVIRHQIAPAEAFVSPLVQKAKAFKESQSQKISDSAAPIVSTANTIQQNKDVTNNEDLQVPSVDFSSSDAFNDTTQANETYPLPKFTIYDEGDEDLSEIHGNPINISASNDQNNTVNRQPTNVVEQASTQNLNNNMHSSEGSATEHRDLDNKPMEIDFTQTRSNVGSKVNAQPLTNDRMRGSDDERVDVWNFSDNDSSDNEDHSSYQTSSNIGAFTPEDPNEAINRAADLTNFDDDIPSFLPPGQRSVLDDEDDYMNKENSSFNDMQDVSDIPQRNDNIASVNNSNNSSASRAENIEGYFKSLNEEVTPDSLRALKGKYDPNNLPPVTLLNSVPPKPAAISQTELDFLSRQIEEKLRDFRIEAKVCGAEPGPVITRYALELSPGTKAKAISNISSDLARVLAVQSVRVVEIIPGTTYVGLEIANAKRQTVYFRELIDSEIFSGKDDKLTCGLGCSVVGNPVVMNLAKMPHLLVAGTTGSGKSVGVNGMILSMLFKSTPDDLRLIMIDPKMLEFSSYNNIPHLLTEVVTDMKDASNALRWCVGEMERRYKLMMKLNVKKIDEYNEKVLKAIEYGEPILDPLWERTAQLSEKRPYLGKLPYIVVVIDELADMMMQVGKKVEELIARLAQKARAAGIHMIIATQSPRADVLTGIIKSNIPSRLAFTVSNGLESRIIIEQQGAETLLGNGDMLFNPTGSNSLSRIHGAYVSPAEIDRVVNFWREQGEPEYVDNIFDDEVNDENALPSEKAEIAARSSDAAGKDELFDEAVQVILQTKKASTSILQRKMGIGYPRAAKLIDSLEDAGIISAPINSAGKRRILIDDHFSSDDGDY